MNCAEARLCDHWPDAAPTTDEQRAVLAQHLEGCDACQAELAELQALDALIAEGPLSALEVRPHEIPLATTSWERLRAHLDEREAAPPCAAPALAPAIGEDEQASRTGPFAWLSALWERPLAMAIPALLAAVVVWSMGTQPRSRGQGPHPAVGPSPWVAKGGLPPLVELLFAPPDQSLRGFGTPQLAREGQRLHPGDFVQLRYALPRQAHGLVVSLNGRGEIFAFFPFRGQNSAPLMPGEGTLPPQGAWELDDVLGAERIYVLLGLRPFGVDGVGRALKAARGPHKALPRCAQVRGPWWCKSFLLTKQKRPPGRRKR